MAKAIFSGKSKILLIILNIIGLTACMMLILKVPYGYGTTDECYYLLSPLKVLGGDAMLKDEWFVAQLFGFLTLPLLKLYMLIFQGTEGIILTFRYIYVFIKIAAAVFVYRRLKRQYDIFPSFIASIIFLIYTPFDIMALSYNTIGHICMCMSMAVFVTLADREKIASVLAGVLYAAAVLCCPYLAVIYMIYTLVFLCTRRARRVKNIPAFKTGTWVRATCGIAALAVLFIIFLFSRASFSELTDSLPHILNNPTHEPLNIFSQIKTYIHLLYLWDRKRLIIFIFLALICALFLFVKKIKKFRWISFIIAAFLTLCYVFLPGATFNLVNQYILPVNIFGFVCLFLTNRKDYRLFWGMWVPGMIYSFAIFLSSNQGFYILSSASIVSLPASIIFIISTAKDIEEDMKAAGICVSIFTLLLICFQIAAISSSVLTHCFWDENRFILDMVIEEGCEKGIHTSRAYYNLYKEQRDNTAILRSIPDGRVMYYASLELWLALDDPKQPGSCFSYYFGPDEYRLSELNTYYSLYPDKKPQYYYFETDTDINMAIEKLGLNKDNFTQTSLGSYIYIQ